MLSMAFAAAFTMPIARPMRSRMTRTRQVYNTQIAIPMYSKTRTTWISDLECRPSSDQLRARASSRIVPATRIASRPRMDVQIMVNSR
jgi:hypothetical protein